MTTIPTDPKAAASYIARIQEEVEKLRGTQINITVRHINAGAMEEDKSAEAHQFYGKSMSYISYLAQQIEVHLEAAMQLSGVDRAEYYAMFEIAAEIVEERHKAKYDN